MIDKLLSKKFSNYSILHFTDTKSYMYTDNWSWDLDKISKLKNYDLVIADFSKEHYGSDTIKYAYSILEENNINFLLLSFDPADHLTQSRLLYYPYFYYNTRDNSLGYTPLYSIPQTFDQNIISDQKKYKFSCLNGNPRTHKIFNLIELKKKSYIDDILLEFYYSDAWKNDRLTMNDQTAKEWELIKDTFLPCTELYKNNKFPEHDILKSAYTDSYVHLVVEFSAAPKLFVTEKTFKPIAAGQLFLIIGAMGIIQHLRDIGIDTFDDLIDHDHYDKEPDWEIRIKKLHEVMDILASQDLLTLNNLTKVRRRNNAIRYFENMLDADYIKDIETKIYQCLAK